MGHYHGCTSYLGFLQRSYFCDTCNKGFDRDDFRNHHTRAVAVKHASRPNGVLNLTNPLFTAQTATSQNCLALHRAKNICYTLVRYGNCCKQFQPDPQQPHRCYFGKCPICKEYVEKLGDLVLYYDTDSVIYIWKPGQIEIELGDYLGDMTNELDRTRLRRCEELWVSNKEW